MSNDKEKRSDSNQSLALVGIALIIIAVILIVYALKMPRIKTESGSATTVTASQSVREKGEIQTPEPLFPLNINTATAEELSAIDGLGEKRAQAIIEYRDYLGGYTSLEQIMDIDGFSKATYDKISPYLTL